MNLRFCQLKKSLLSYVFASTRRGGGGNEARPTGIIRAGDPQNYEIAFTSAHIQCFLKFQLSEHVQVLHELITVGITNRDNFFVDLQIALINVINFPDVDHE
jgi:hypothetical protein